MLQFTLSFLSFMLSFGFGEKIISRSSESFQQEKTVYYLIRHAEKKSDDATPADPELSEAGHKRAAAWAHYFEELELDAIYSTNYRRTQQTAQPVAARKTLPVKSYDPGELFSEAFGKDHKGKKILVVGHSNTTPAFANFLLKERKYADLPESEYSTLYILTEGENGNFTSEVVKL